MVIKIVCQGGLGNQLFIWAAAHQLNKIYGDSVEITYLDNSKPIIMRELYPLLEFCSHEIRISQSRSLGRQLDWLDRVVFKIPNLRDWHIYKRILDDYSNPHLELTESNSKPLCVRGYFQNNKIVDTNSVSIFSEIKAYFDKLNLPRISQNYGAIHVRRGDYVKSRNYYGVLTNSYYKKLICSEMEYVLFVEDRNDVKDFERLHNIKRVVDSDEASAWETLALMHFAKELHMANSTLSWWAGKISTEQPKRITMPFPWHNEGYSFQELLISPNFELKKADYEKYD